MSRPVVSITPDAPVLQAGAIMGSNGIKRLAVIDGERLLGLVTQTDITRGMVSLWPYKEVADIMSTKVVTANASATVAEVAGLMSSRNISCVVVVRQRDPVGIMTEKDVLKRVVALRRAPGTTLVADVMSHPIVTLPPSHSILCASRVMDRMRIHRLVVKENKQVYGIVSQTDILHAVRGELEQIREAQLRREAEVSRLMECTAQNLSLIESLVRNMSGSAELSGQPSARPGMGGHACCGGPAPESHGPHPASGVSPILISLQDLISESKGNLYRVSRIMERQRGFTGELDQPKESAQHPRLVSHQGRTRL